MEANVQRAFEGFVAQFEDDVDPQWDDLAIFCDVLVDLGKEDMLRGARWLVENKKWPKYITDINGEYRRPWNPYDWAVVTPTEQDREWDSTYRAWWYAFPDFVAHETVPMIASTFSQELGVLPTDRGFQAKTWEGAVTYLGFKLRTEGSTNARHQIESG